MWSAPALEAPACVCVRACIASALLSCGEHQTGLSASSTTYCTRRFDTCQQTTRTGLDLQSCVTAATITATAADDDDDDDDATLSVNSQ